jgi:ATP-binding cassette subfamily B protein
VAKAETDTAEAFRLQRHLFDLATAAGSGKEIRVAGAGPSLAARQAAVWDEMVAGRLRARLRAAAWKAAGWALFTLAFVGALALVVELARTGAATAGDVVLTLTIALSLRESAHAAARRAAEVGRETRLVEPFLWLRDYVAAERARAAGTRPAPAALREGITLDRVSYTYPGTAAPAVDGLSVRLPAGAVVAVVGEYGSGKTTLVKLLGKLYRPDSGAILVDGVDLADLDTVGWRSRMSAAFQDFGRFHSTVAVAVGLGDLAALEDRERIAEALRTADAEALVARLPDGIDTQLGRELGGVDLSEGQWQKTALARASMRTDPLLFVLDEPTASLDAPSEHAIFTRYMARARELAARTGAITVVVSHRFSTVSGADLILVMAGGALVEVGTHAELVGAGGRYADLYGIQADAYAMG